MTKEKKETTVEKVEDTVKTLEKKAIKTAKKIGKNIEKAVEETVEEVKEAFEEKDDKKAKLAKLLAKAKKLEGEVEDVKDVDLKKKVKQEEDKKEDTLVPMDDYLKSSIHLGTRVITPDMRKYVYRRRADGLAVFNTALLDDKIRESAEYLVKFAPSDFIVVCKREAGWQAAKKFAETLGIKYFTKKYPAGVLTNTKLDNFFETNMIFICDPWLDKNALEDANRVGIPVMSICDTNNFTRGIDNILPGNNKSAKSLGMIFYLLTKIYIEKRKLDIPIPAIQEFIGDWDNLLPPK